MPCLFFKLCCFFKKLFYVIAVSCSEMTVVHFASDPVPFIHILRQRKEDESLSNSRPNHVCLYKDF